MLNQDSISADDHDEPSRQIKSDDRRLIRRVGKGDQTAFGQIYNHHNVKVYNYILRLVHEQDAAEELLQETFVAVWQGAARFRGRSSVKTWIFRIAHNQAVSWLRKHAGHELVDDRQIPAVEWQVDESIMVEWQVEQVVSALERLSPNHRAVIELVFDQELSYTEVARVLDCPVGTVKSRMSYALKHLNQLLRDSDLDK